MFNKSRTYFLLTVILLFTGYLWLSGKDDVKINEISSSEQFKAIVEGAGPGLVAFNLYTDWSLPSRVLEPILRDVAEENSEKVTFYKINLDNFPQLSEFFEASGIPFVVFIRNRKAVHALTGVQPKSAYENVINMYCDTSDVRSRSPQIQFEAEGLLVTENSRQKTGRNMALALVVNGEYKENKEMQKRE